MAAVGILTALHHRDATGEGQVVDVSMADGALSWMAMVAARVLAGDPPPERGRDILSGGVVCYRPYQCADGWVTLGALEPKFFAAWCAGVGREDLIEHQFEAPGSAAHVQIQGVFMERTRDRVAGVRLRGATAAWSPCSTSPRRSTPSSSPPARWSSRSTSPGRPRRCALLGMPIKLSAHARRPAAAARPGAGRAHRRRCWPRRASPRTRRRPSRRPARSPARPRGPRGSFLS